MTKAYYDLFTEIIKGAVKPLLMNNDQPDVQPFQVSSQTPLSRNL